MRFDPFAELDRLAREPFAARRPVMPMDAYRRGDRFVVRFDLPGADPDSIDLTVEKNVLTVRAERGWTPEEGDEVLAAERPQGSFARQLFLGETLDSERIEAGYHQGVLTVTIPVAERAKARKVAISGGPSEEPAAVSTGSTIDAGSTEASAA